ncbi:PH domain-containing protein [Streptomyces sp. NPDC053048]|uniref:PH domain-containing protein n=1 Tax=Streptomyces sp. NPDC053048 TaxID=3365694 RepID=UPI0037D45D3F
MVAGNQHHSQIGRLRPPRHRVGPRARRWWAAQAWLAVSGPLLLAAAALLVCSVLFFPVALPWLAPLVGAVLVLPALVYALAMPAGRYRATGWELGRAAVYAAGGCLWRRRRIVPLARVREVAVRRGPLQRRYGLATVTVTTGSSASDLRIAGVPEADARLLAERIGAAAGVRAEVAA